MNKEEEFDKRQQDVRTNYNTAQKVFVDKMTELIAGIGTGGKTVADFQFPIALSGSLDFSKLPVSIKMFLAGMKKISFAPGEITDIRGWNVLRNMAEVNFSQQLLTELDVSESREPMAWKVVNLEKNGLREFDWRKCMSIKNVNLSYNRFVRVGVLPRTLEILDVRNNRLELLDLSHGSNLRYINASNNTSSMVLIPPPRENTDYELIQTNTSPYMPSLEPESDSDSEPESDSGSKKQNKRESIIRNVDYKEGLKDYFRYRSEYENSIAKEKRQIWNKYRYGKKGSLSLARQMLSRYVPTCLNCQQPGGMIFQFLPEERKYKGLCGASYPCNFHIEVFSSGNYIRLTDLLENEYKYSEECKQTLITQKQEILFGYIDEISGLKKSKKTLEDCNETMENIKYYEKKHENLYDSERRRRIDELTLQIGQWITQNKVLLSPETVAAPIADILAGRQTRSRALRGSDWEEGVVEEEEKGREEERLRMVVETEVCSLFPLVHKLRNETYDVMNVEIDEEKGGCRLIQEKIAFSRGEFNLDIEDPAVISFTNG